MPFKKEKLAWHEKSVEYKFVIDGAGGVKFDIAWPLDGNEEKLGDTVFRTDYNYYIVEFKGNFEAFDKEYKKFSDDGRNSEEGKKKYLDAKRVLAELGAAYHFMVCGDVEGEGDAAKFVLRRYQYFQCDSKTAAPLTDAIEGGACEVMRRYIETYAPYKKGELTNFGDDSSEDGSGGGMANGATNLLVGINTKLRTGRVWNLNDCLKLELKPLPTMENSDSKKSVLRK
jgi:hypothetical protein